MRCRVDILTSNVLAVAKVVRVGRRLELTFGPHAVAVVEIAERRRLDEHGSFRRRTHCSDLRGITVIAARFTDMTIETTQVSVLYKPARSWPDGGLRRVCI